MSLIGDDELDEEEIVRRMRIVADTCKLFGELEAVDSKAVGMEWEELMDTTCEFSIEEGE